ncbi:MAG: hypothetical protein ACFE7R_02855 [Candidatus Hodarchaeota archaeon]
MKAQTKLICIGAVFMIFLSGIIILAVFDDVEGPFIYQIDVLPTSPKPGDTISVVIYAIDRSGVSSAELSWSINAGEWHTEEMQFFACLCIAGGRWAANFGPVEEGDTGQFFVTAFDDSVNRNPSDSQTFSIEITS